MAIDLTALYFEAALPCSFFFFCCVPACGKQELQKLFGSDLKTADGDGELSFQEYLKVVSVRLTRQQVSSH